MSKTKAMTIKAISICLYRHRCPIRIVTVDAKFYVIFTNKTFDCDLTKEFKCENHLGQVLIIFQYRDIIEILGKISVRESS